MLVAAALALAVWLYLLLCRGGYWRADVRLGDASGVAERWPPVVAVVPARDEARCVGASIGSLLAQDYPGELDVVLVDDESADGTSDAARGAADAHVRAARLRVVSTPPRPVGWVGKMWAVHTGVARAAELRPDAAYLLLTDADVVHPPHAVRRLVAKAEAGRFDLVSLMVMLDVRTGWERLLIPAFVYFFQMLYPFRWIGARGVAAAAGGCMLVRRDALARIGGVEAIRAEVIDDCALARAVARGGPIWLGLAEEARSIRPYGGLRGVWSMVARTAYTQLRHSPLLLSGTVLGMVALYMVPPLAALSWPLHRDAAVAGLGAAAWLVMAVTFVPTLALYRRSPLWGLALPLAGLLYTGMTLDSARRHARGRGGAWKGRFAAEAR